MTDELDLALEGDPLRRRRKLVKAGSNAANPHTGRRSLTTWWPVDDPPEAA